MTDIKKASSDTKKTTASNDIKKPIASIGRKDGVVVQETPVEEEQKNKRMSIGLIVFAVIGASAAAIVLYNYFKTNDNTVLQVKDMSKVTEEPASVRIKKDGSDNPNSGAFYKKNAIDLNPKEKNEQYDLAIRYMNGDGVNKDYQEAIKWLSSAAAQEHKESQGMLGQIYYYGEIAKPDFKKALIWNTLAASQGLKEAQYILGLMYEHGEGVIKDKAEAKKWFELAAAQGVAEAQAKLNVQETVKVEPEITEKKPEKLVTNDDMTEVNKYLSNIKKPKTPSAPPSKEKEIIWNSN